MIGINCQACGTELAAQASACPRCGALAGRLSRVGYEGHRDPGQAGRRSGEVAGSATRQPHSLRRLATWLTAMLAGFSPERRARTVTGSRRIARVVGMAAALTLAALTVYLPAAWASGPVLMAGQQWLIKDNDLAVIGGIGSYQWIGCGLTTAPLTPRNYTPCHPGQDRIYASWWRFRDAVRDGRQPAGSTAIFDNETWAYTPKIEQADQRKYERLAGRLARARGITLVMTPYAPTQAAMIADDVTAGRYASVVEIQSQSLIGARARPLLDDVPAFAAFVAADVAAIRKASPTVPILAGLATDAGGIPVTAAQMFDAYQAIRASVAGFWLNADTWARPRGRGCAPAGCPLVAAAFLADLGVTGPAGQR